MYRYGDFHESTAKRGEAMGTDFLAIILMLLILGTHWVLIHSKIKVLGAIIPCLLFICGIWSFVSFKPDTQTAIYLIGCFAIAIFACTYLWIKALKK